MKRRSVCGSMAAVLGLLFGACQSNLSTTAPPVTPAFVQAGARQNADSSTLTQGRTVLLSRCIQCHTLPDVARYEAPRLKAIVAAMSHRASLTPDQHDAVLKYLLTARAQVQHAP